MNKMTFVAFLWLMTPLATFGQKQISGTVLDAETESALPFTNIQIENTYRGTTSNDEGKYSLKINELPATVVVRYIGYETQRLTVTESSPDVLNIVLKPVVLEMDAVIVTGEDPAIRIMREVIKRKQQWWPKLETYKAETYSRTVIENDTSIVMIIENTTNLFWDRDRGSHEVIKSRKRTENLRNFEWASSESKEFPNFYADDVEMGGHNVIGPTHPDALKHYRFELLGQRALDDKIVYDISITPKSKLQPTFVGQISVLDEEYAMIDARLKRSEAMVSPFPIQEMDVAYEQQFSNFDAEYWLPVDVQSKGYMKIGITALLSFPEIHFNALSRITDYEVNGPLPDSLFEKKGTLTFDSLALAIDSLLVGETDIIPLTDLEQQAYNKIDSSYTMERVFKPKGLLSRFVEFDDDEASGEKKGISFGLSPDIGFNRVDAGVLGLGGAVKVSRFEFGAHGNYKTARKSFGYGGKLKAGLGKGFWTGLNYLKDTVPSYGAEHYTSIGNGLTAIQGGEDYFNYYSNEKTRFEIGYGRDSSRPVGTQIRNDTRLELVLGVQTEEHHSLTKRTDFNIYGFDVTRRPNPAIEAGTLRSIELKATLGDALEPPLGVMERKRLQLLVEHSSPDFLASDFSFTRYEVTLDWRLQTFLRRRFLPNVLDIRLAAGTSSGDLPIQRFGTLEARLGPFTPFGVFKTLKLPVPGRKHLGLYWEHNFRTVPFEILGWRTLVKHHISIIVHGAHGKTWGTPLNEAVYPLQSDNGYHELGLSVNGILGIFRLDATKRLDSSGFYVGFSFARFL